MRFTLTAGQKGDAPQAADLIEGLPAEVVMADAAYDADHLRQAIAAKRALRRHSKQPFPRAQAPARQASLCPSASSSNAASQSSNNSGALQLASKKAAQNCQAMVTLASKALAKRRQQGLSIYSRCGAKLNSSPPPQYRTVMYMPGISPIKKLATRSWSKCCPTSRRVSCARRAADAAKTLIAGRYAQQP